MSDRRWNSESDRKQYERYLQLASLLLQQDIMLNGDSSDDSSSSSDSSDGNGSIAVTLIKAAIELKNLRSQPLEEESIQSNADFVIRTRGLDDSISDLESP
jgi:hypothetical protein